jgi:hypothetical protein
MIYPNIPVLIGYSYKTRILLAKLYYGPLIKKWQRMKLQQINYNSCIVKNSKKQIRISTTAARQEIGVDKSIELIIMQNADQLFNRTVYRPCKKEESQASVVTDRQRYPLCRRRFQRDRPYKQTEQPPLHRKKCQGHQQADIHKRLPHADNTYKAVAYSRHCTD